MSSRWYWMIWVCLLALPFFFFKYIFLSIFCLMCLPHFFAFQGPSLKQFMDIFSLPEMTLLSSVIDYFITHGIEFDQVHLYKDISVSKMSTVLELILHENCEQFGLWALVSSAAPKPKGLLLSSLIWQHCCPFRLKHYQGIFKVVFSEHVRFLSVVQS